ncbi:MAG: retention module-containing protein [Cycloclasticus sp.]|nr:retention module-containing protein [Cycloclasticus sp.]
MASVGAVKSVTGLVRVIAENGTERILSVGDAVNEHEKIITGSGEISIAFNDGSLMDLASNSSTVLNGDVLNQGREQAANDEVAALQDALADPNFDPTTDLPATAAGTPGVTGNNGHTLTNIDYLSPEVTVKSGFDTVGISQEFLQPEEELPPVIDSPPEADHVLTEASRGGELPSVLQEALSELGVSGAILEGSSVTATVSVATSGQTGSVGYVYFTIDADTAITITTDGPTIDPNMWLFSDDGLLDVGDALAYDDDDGASAFSFNNSIINTNDEISGPILPAGSYIIAVGDYHLSDIEAVDGVNDSSSILALSGDVGITIEADAANITVTDAAAENIAFYKQLTVDGIIGDSDFGVADFGGSDKETSLENLVFTLSSEPTYGSLILITAGGATSELNAGNTFTSADTVWWYATEEEHAAFEGDAPQAVVFDYLVTDENGQTADATVTILTPNSNPVAGESLIAVDEDGLEAGITGGAGDLVVPNDDGDNNEATASGQLSYSFGLDGVGGVDFASLHGNIVQATGDDGLQNLTSGGNPITYVWDGAAHTLTGIVSVGGNDNESYEYPVFVLTVTDVATGDYTFELLEQVDHPTANTEDDFVLDLPFTVTDSDGDTASGSLQVTIDDDMPVVALTESTGVAYEFLVTNHDEVSSAGYHNSYGYYIKDVDGNPTDGVVIWDDVHDTDTVPVTVTGYTPEQIGFFIIANGENKNASLEDNTDITFEFVSGQWQAFADGAALLGAGSHVIFDRAELNKDGQDHMQDNDLTGSQNWEDLQIPRGDGDYNDVNIDVVWTEVSATGDAVDVVSYGADGAGSIDFSFDSTDVTLTGDALTSNGNEIFFIARDTNDDGHNDQIVGQTGDETVVLTIDGVLDSSGYEVSVLGAIDDTVNSDLDIAIDLAVTDSDGDMTMAMLNINIDINTLIEAPVSVL